jgi:outer membrane protein TolC
VWAAPRTRNTDTTRFATSPRTNTVHRKARSDQLRKLSLSAAVKLATRFNLDLKASRAEILAARAKVKGARSGLMPTISVLGVVQVQRKYELDMLPPELQEPLQALFPDLDPDALKTTIQDRWNAIVGVSVIQPLTSLYPLYKVWKVEEVGVSALKESLASKKNALAKEVAHAYLANYKAKSYLAIAKQAHKLVQAHLDRVKKLLSAEAVRRAELLQVQVKLAETQHAVIRARSAVQLSRELLKHTIGLGPSTRLKLTQTFADPPPALDIDLQTCIKRAHRRRPELRMIQKRMRQADLGRQAAWFQYVPTVAVMAGYQFTHGMESMFPTHRWFVGGLATWSWEWGKKKYKVDELTAKKLRAKHLYAKAKSGIRLQVTKYYLDLKTAREGLAVRRKAVKQATERHRIEVQRYALNASTTTDVLNAQTALKKAKAEHANALFSYYEALANLKEATGGRLH